MYEVMNELLHLAGSNWFLSQDRQRSCTDMRPANAPSLDTLGTKRHSGRLTGRSCASVLLSRLLILTTLFTAAASSMYSTAADHATSSDLLRTRNHRYKQTRSQGRVNSDAYLQLDRLAVAIQAAKKTVTLSDGDLVSCIPITKQPAVTDSATPIQLEPSMVPSKPQNQNGNRKGSKQASQRFALEVGSCPAGTIPVRRRSPDQTTAESDQLDSSSALVSIHEHAYASTTIVHPPSFKGTEVILNVWEPLVEPHCFSLAQLWLINTGLAFPYNSSDGLLNTIEAGWQVFPDLYGDNHARLFIYWTGDDYQETGCYNLNQGCEAGSLGFIQVSNKVLIGGSIAPTSIVNSTQYEIKLQVFKVFETFAIQAQVEKNKPISYHCDAYLIRNLTYKLFHFCHHSAIQGQSEPAPTSPLCKMDAVESGNTFSLCSCPIANNRDDISGNWWLQFNDEFVGYWPRSLFHSLKDTADAIDWGGEVIVHNGNSPHMHTNMGSGEAAYLGYKKAAYQRNLQYVGTDNALHIATGLEAVTEAALCYGIMAKSSKYWGSFVYYGGSGSCCNFSL